MLSYNYGARRPARVRKSIRVVATLVLLYTALTWSVILLAPEALIRIFSSDATLVSHAVRPLNLYFAAFVFMDLQYIGQMVFKSLNKKKQAIFFSILRKVVIVVPLTYFLPFGLSKMCIRDSGGDAPPGADGFCRGKPVPLYIQLRKISCV